jgi:hypothetical protein
MKFSIILVCCTEKNLATLEKIIRNAYFLCITKNVLPQVTTDTAVTECFFKDGVMHGPVRKFGMKKFREFRQQLLFVGRYRSRFNKTFENL